MSILDISNLDRALIELSVKNKIPEKILIGYKTYGKLMKDRKFLEEITSSAIDPNKRKYKKIKIKITPNEYQLEVKCSN